ncbi:hypothetical protein IE077_003824, partial [Cardiosporidium cionae]
IAVTSLSPLTYAYSAVQYDPKGENPKGNHRHLLARLEELQNATESARSRVMATLQANQPQFVRTAEQVLHLEMEVKQLKKELLDLQATAEALAEERLGIPKGTAFSPDGNEESTILKAAKDSRPSIAGVFPSNSDTPSRNKSFPGSSLEKSKEGIAAETAIASSPSKKNGRAAPYLEHLTPAGDIREASIDYQHLLESVSTLRAASEFLEALCHLQSVLSDFDRILETQAYDIAAEHIQSASEILNNLSAHSLNEEPEILQDIKLDYLQRRGRLISRLDEAFIQFFIFQPGQVIVRQTLAFVDRNESELLANETAPSSSSPPLNLSDLLYALRSLNLFEQRIESLAQFLKNNIITLLFDEVLLISENFHLIENMQVDENQITAAWSWNTCKISETETTTSGIQASSSSVSQAAKASHTMASPATPHELIIPLLQSLMKFVGHPQAMGSFGRYIWGLICKKLLQELPSPTFQGSELLKEFETSMLAIDLIPPTEKRLSKYVARFREALYDQRKIAILSEARELILLSSEDTSVICVSDSTEVGSLSTGMCVSPEGVALPKRTNSHVEDENASKDTRAQQKDIVDETTSAGVSKRKFFQDSTSFSVSPSFSSSTASYITEKERSYRHSGQHPASSQEEVLTAVLEESDSFMRLPRCSVSRHTHKLVQTLLGLLDEAVDASNKNQLHSSQQLFLLVRELASLFIMIRPSSSKVQLLADPQMCAIFFSDCTYLAYHLMTTPFTHGSKLRKSLSQYCFFLDLIIALRKLQETFFMHMMGIQRQRILSSFHAIGDLRNLSSDDEYFRSEAAMSGAMSLLGSILSCWRSILPFHVCAESFALLVNIFLKSLVNKVLTVGDLSSADVNALVLLLSSTAFQLESLLSSPMAIQDYKEKQTRVASSAQASALVDKSSESLPVETELFDIKTSISYWESFELMRNLLSSDFSVLMQQRERFSKAFNADDLRRLLSLNPYLHQSIESALVQLTKA